MGYFTRRQAEEFAFLGRRMWLQFRAVNGMARIVNICHNIPNMVCIYIYISSRYSHIVAFREI